MGGRYFNIENVVFWWYNDFVNGGMDFVICDCYCFYEEVWYIFFEYVDFSNFCFVFYMNYLGWEIDVVGWVNE